MDSTYAQSLGDWEDDGGALKSNMEVRKRGGKIISLVLDVLSLRRLGDI